MKKTVLFLLAIISFFYTETSISQTSHESFESETVSSTSFTSDSKSFTIVNGQVQTFANGGVGDSQRYIDNTGSCGSQPELIFKTTDGSDIYVHSLFAYSSTSCSGVPTNTTESSTINGYKDNNLIFTVTIDDSGGNVTWTNQGTNGFTYIDLVSLGHGNKLVDEIRFNTSSSSVTYAAMDEIIWSTSSVKDYVFENFESASDNSTTFTSNAQSFTLNNSLQIQLSGTDGAGESTKFIDNLDASPSIIADGGTPYSASIETTDGKDISLKGFYLYMSNTAGYNDLHSVGVTVKGYKDGSATPVFTQTFSPPFDDDNKGFNFIDISDANQAILIDKFEVIPLNNTSGGANEVHYLAIDNLIWSPTAPIVTTSDASSVASTSATLSGNVTSNGGASVTERGIVYSKTSENANPLVGGSMVIKDTNGSGTGVFTESISGLSAGTSYSFKAYAENSVGISYGTLKTFTTTGKGWTGATNTNWATASNWSPNAVPLSSDNLIIPNVANKPVISSSTGAIANNITIDANSSITVESGGSLIINGTAAINGDFIYKVRVNDDKFHLISSPVAGEQYNDAWNTLNGIDTNLPNEAIATYINTSDADGDWVYYQHNVSGTLNFNSGVGYSMKNAFGSGGDYSFIGTLPVAPINATITANDIGGANQNRWTLVGNPFPAHINIATFLSVNATPLTNTHENVYVWDAANNKYEPLSTGFLHPGQGFFVNSNVASTSVTFTKAMQSDQNGVTFYKNTNPRITLNITDGNLIKATEINYLSGKTTGLDPRFDVGTFTGQSTNFNLYTHLVSNSEGVNFMKQALPNNNYENMVIPVGVNAETGKEITFSLNANNFNSDIKIFLEDRETNTFTRLDEVNSNYKITLTNAQNGIGRFYLHTTENSLSIDRTATLENVSVYKLNKTTLRVAGLNHGKSNIAIFNLLGKQVLQTSFTTEGVKDISLPKLSKGVYLIKIQTDFGKLSKKIIIE